MNIEKVELLNIERNWQRKKLLRVNDKDGWNKMSREGMIKI